MARGIGSSRDSHFAGAPNPCAALPRCRLSTSRVYLSRADPSRPGHHREHRRELRGMGSDFRVRNGWSSLRTFRRKSRNRTLRREGNHDGVAQRCRDCQRNPGLVDRLNRVFRCQLRHGAVPQRFRYRGQFANCCSANTEWSGDYRPLSRRVVGGCCCVCRSLRLSGWIPASRNPPHHLQCGGTRSVFRRGAAHAEPVGGADRRGKFW